MSKTGHALITGASSGIGRALAYEFAADGVPLILVARNKDNLAEVQADISTKYGIDILIYPLDLGEVDASNKLHAWTSSKGVTVKFLVNNAGFGDRDDVINADLNKLQAMIDLNIRALITLSKLYASDMAKSGNGNILNIASIAGLVPGPGMAVYYASKAFVLSFSQALDAELRSKGVVVTAICPGPTETGFAAAANAEKSPIFNGKLATSQEVAVFSYRAMQQGDTVAIYDRKYRILSRFISLVPRKRLVGIIRRAQ